MTINPVNKTEVAYHQLEKMIIFRELEPGSMVSEKQLAESLGVGRTPVREALQRLSYERMAEIHPRRGIQIPPISIESQLKFWKSGVILRRFAFVMQPQEQPSMRSSK